MGRSAGVCALLGLALLAVACGRGPNATAPLPPVAAPPMIARDALFGEPAREGARISPQGDLIAFLAPHDGKMQLWVVPTAALGQARVVTSGPAILDFAWAAGGRTLLAFTDENGDEDYLLSAVDVATSQARSLTDSAHADIVGISPSDPGGVIVALNTRDRTAPDLYRIDIATGSRTPVETNTRQFFRYVVDRDNRVRLGLKMTPDGAIAIWSRAQNGRWSLLSTIPYEDALSSDVLNFETGGVSFLMRDSTGRDRAALVRVDAATGVKTVLGESARADVVDVWINPATGAPQAFAADYLRRDWRALDADAQADLNYLDTQLEGDPRVISRSADDKIWIVEEDGPAIAPRTWLYNRADPGRRALTLLFRNRPALDNAPLQPMIPVEIEARDGLTLVSYLTLPIGSDANGDSRPDNAVPLVILPHSGPWARDSYGFNALHQWLANRGYAALSVNFRGSTGFGKAFLNAGAREWGGKMQNDLLDAVQWAVDEGVAQPDRVAIFGAGYGGYAALHALSFTPQRFACGVDIAGPSNLEAWLSSLPQRSEWMRPSLYLRVADPRTQEGRDLLHSRSPIWRAQSVERPLLIAQGARDVHVARTESDLMSQGVRLRTGLVYLVYPEAGALAARKATRLSLFAVADQFLSGCLGGRAEPIGGAFTGVRAQSLAGADRIEGLVRFAPPPPPPPATSIEAAPTAASAPPLSPEPAAAPN